MGAKIKSTGPRDAGLTLLSYDRQSQNLLSNDMSQVDVTADTYVGAGRTVCALDASFFSGAFAFLKKWASHSFGLALSSLGLASPIADGHACVMDVTYVTSHDPRASLVHYASLTGTSASLSPSTASLLSSSRRNLFLVLSDKLPPACLPTRTK